MARKRKPYNRGAAAGVDYNSIMREIDACETIDDLTYVLQGCGIYISNDTLGYVRNLEWSFNWADRLCEHLRDGEDDYVIDFLHRGKVSGANWSQDWLCEVWDGRAGMWRVVTYDDENPSLLISYLRSIPPNMFMEVIMDRKEHPRKPPNRL